MNFLYVCLVIVLVGVLLWAANRWIPMDAKIKKILNIFVVVVLVIWLISLLIPGLWSHVNAVKLPK